MAGCTGRSARPVQSVWKEAADDSDRNKWKHRILRYHIGAVRWFTTEFLKVMEYLSIWASVRRFCDVTGCMKGRDLDNKDWLIPQWKPTLSIISGSDVVSERSLHGRCWKHLDNSKNCFFTFKIFTLFRKHILRKLHLIRRSSSLAKNTKDWMRRGKKSYSCGLKGLKLFLSMSVKIHPSWGKN